MAVDFTRVSTLLKNIHLFNNLTDGQIAEIIRRSSELTLASNSVLFREGDDADNFFLILEGKIQLTGGIAGKSSWTALLFEGDYFGQEALVGKPTRIETASAVTDCSILRVSYTQVRSLIQHTPGLKANLQAAEIEPSPDQKEELELDQSG